MADINHDKWFSVKILYYVQNSILLVFVQPLREIDFNFILDAISKFFGIAEVDKYDNEKI